jgi:hypothetical protein
VEWTSPNFKYVDTYAKHDYSNSVEGCLKTPHPPGISSAPPTYYVPYSHKPTDDEKAEARKEYRYNYLFLFCLCKFTQIIFLMNLILITDSLPIPFSFVICFF